MEMSDLELFTSQELVDELLRRKTFLGVIVQSSADHKGEWAPEQVFQVRFNANLNKCEASRLLDVIADSLDREWCD